MIQNSHSGNSTVKVAIDGPSASGKSTTARKLAAKYGFTYVDSGAIYRTVTLLAILNGCADPINIPMILQPFSNSFNLSMSIPSDSATLDVKVELNGVDVSKLIRTAIVEKYTSEIAKIKEVREKVREVQQRLIHGSSSSRIACHSTESNPNGISGVVIDGRDIGTAIMPDAQVKIFMKADAEVRAQRRLEQIISTDANSNAGKEKYEEILSAIIARDRDDENREHSPLTQAEDAIVLDNSKLSFEQQVSVISYAIEKVISSISH